MNRFMLGITLFLLYSFLGWILESLFCFYEDKKFVNRGFLIGPVCPIYGVGCLLLVTILGSLRKRTLILFILSMVICGILEYFTSYVLEKIFKTRWWDYSQKKYNLNGRVCLEHLIAFGVLGVLMVSFVNPFMVKSINLIDEIYLKAIVIFFSVIFLLDLVVSIKIIYNIKGVGLSVIKDQTEEISIKVKEVLLSQGRFTKRVIKAFPNFIVRNSKGK